MKIIYDVHQKAYLVKIEEIETLTMFPTTDIVEAREGFIKCATRWFNNAICEQLKGEQNEEAL